MVWTCDDADQNKHCSVMVVDDIRQADMVRWCQDGREKFQSFPRGCTGSELVEEESKGWHFLT